MTDRELDALVAEKVFGATPLPPDENGQPMVERDGIKKALPHYSQGLRLAWPVVIRLRELHWHVSVRDLLSPIIYFDERDKLRERPWECGFDFRGAIDIETAATQRGFVLEVGRRDASLPRAICLAALDALGAL